jgi:hypothetical protein
VRSFKRIAGYAILFILSLVPAAVGYMYEANANQIGLMYVGTLAWASIAWVALRMIESNEDVV